MILQKDGHIAFQLTHVVYGGGHFEMYHRIKPMCDYVLSYDNVNSFV